jgi:5-deoxy-glucuronate isomerase
MTNLRIRPKAPDAGGRVIDITPASAGWRYVGFEVRRLAAGQAASFAFPDRETCVVVVTGKVDIQAGEARFEGVGGRATAFDDAAPGAVYAPAGVEITVKATSDADVAVCTAPGHGVGAARRGGSRPTTCRAKSAASGPISASSATSCRRPSRPSGCWWSRR